MLYEVITLNDRIEVLVGNYANGRTNPTNPDTDGDGLCDGSTVVAGVCVAGEDTDRAEKKIAGGYAPGTRKRNNFV